MLVVSWNVGLTQSHWLQGGAYRARISDGVRSLCRDYEPQVLMLQELGLHEVGLPKKELQEKLAESAPECEVRVSRLLHIALESLERPSMPATTKPAGSQQLVSRQSSPCPLPSQVVIDQAYATLLQRCSMKPVDRSCCQVAKHHGRQPWRVAQVLTVERLPPTAAEPTRQPLPPTAAEPTRQPLQGQQVKLVNVHLVSSNLTFNGNKHTLTDGTRKVAVETVAAFGKRGRFLIIAGDFNIDLDKLTTFDLVGFHIWGEKRDFILSKGLQSTTPPVDGGAGLKSDAHAPMGGVHQEGPEEREAANSRPAAEARPADSCPVEPAAADNLAAKATVATVAPMGLPTRSPSLREWCRQHKVCQALAVTVTVTGLGRNVGPM